MITEDNIPPQGNMMFFSVPCADPLMSDAEGISGKTCIVHHAKQANADATAYHDVDHSTIETKNQYFISAPKIYLIMFEDV
jgi:hypothetical protein